MSMIEDMDTRNDAEEEKVSSVEMPKFDILPEISQCGEANNSNFEIPTALIVKRTNTSTGARISAPINQEGSKAADEAEAQRLVKEEVPDSQEGLVTLAQLPDPTSTHNKQESSEKSDRAETLSGLNPPSFVKIEVPDIREGLIQQAKPVLVRVKQEPFVESDEANPLSLVPSQIPDSQEGLVLRVKPITTLVKLEASEEADEAEKLHGSKPERPEKKEVPDQQEGLTQQEENVKKIRAVVGSEISELLIQLVLSRCGDNPDAAINYILEGQGISVKRTNTSTGDCISTQLPDLHKGSKPNSQVKKEDPDCQVTLVQQTRPKNLEDGDFPTEQDWLLVGRTFVTALSTSKGRKLFDNEIVHFSFPSANSSHKTRWIVRFSTKQFGEIGRLPMEWAKCVIPLVNSGKVKLRGRCIAAPKVLSMMQEVILYVSFYIHHSIFTEGDHSSWRLDVSPNIDSSIYPLLSQFKLLKIQPYKKAEFTPEELDSRKRLLNIERIPDDGAPVLPLVKRRKGCQQPSEESRDEQAITESSLNKIVGAADVYDLEVVISNMVLDVINILLSDLSLSLYLLGDGTPKYSHCVLKPYQKQALYWMSELEKGIDVEKATQTLHPCWAAYHMCDERVSSVYVNIFTGEATTKFPTATQMARGGILADAMGLGKTVMTIALILARPVRRSSNSIEIAKRRRIDSDTSTPFKPRGGTLVVCPMSLLSQWKDELETHSESESISIFVHYGGYRSTDPKVISVQDVVLTTYGVLSTSYKSDGENSIFHQIDWYRVVLDEAHSIKSSKTQVAQAAFALSSHCRWCLTGTPIQNNLEDLYSLLCFCMLNHGATGHAYGIANIVLSITRWSKLIQRPYESGDPRGLRLIKAILRSLMLRRTKETKDKKGRPILVLPPTDIQTLSVNSQKLNATFMMPFLGDQKSSLISLWHKASLPDLDELARRFLEANRDASTSKQIVPTQAYVEEVVESIRRGENKECPICLELADDPGVSSLKLADTSTGRCPICRQWLKYTDLIACPSESRFQANTEGNWTESSKVLKLLDCLEHILRSDSGAKSIVFSQWTAFLDLLETPMKKRGIGFLRFDGKLSQTQRERVLNEFNETRQKMVLLTSLKTGGVGLNLTAASNVFIMDPWWNPAVEEQAIMRIHRIGQKRTVVVRRFIVKDSVEERMQQVQARKQKLIAGALTDEEVRSARIEELKMLFT
ncbi:putative SWI/SNF-related matrix-associated actin-dependent regulator of chromatin subfamily A member 3-like 3 [Prunus yedoensis var. nudiflora]|uniref:Putative SWI/SNF-related matrix-associated actin-dependent regulator of chromatin subfamily A member 3-like 3 n=1 Tax=Prunus yedoensis var. nudiflora TaxID=2094558 RepID=A0A314UWH7_PRUYE|nr:putative SWI/SNF-related matrix-associated actin-dependent regulator of chromatin subfamily A member 3-like 3 [Prunus yedoensis var. nudiflora]